MSRFSLVFALALVIATSGGCAKHFPKAALEQPAASFVQRCTEGPGAMIYLDERYDDYWGNGYDPTSYLLVGEDSGGGSATAGPPTKRSNANAATSRWRVWADPDTRALLVRPERWDADVKYCITILQSNHHH